MIRLKQIPSYVNGEFRKSPKALRRILNDFNGNPMLEVHDVNDYELMSAIKNANKVQRELGKIPMANVRRLLEDTMHNYFHNKTKYETIVKLNGSPINFVREGMDFVKNWCFCAEGFLGRALEKGNITYRNTAPIVTILPSNSEQVMLYVVAQNLLSRNATILRPSSKGAGAYNSNEFVLALNKTIDKLNQKELYPLKNAVSVINTPADSGFLEKLCVDGWNYIFFGDDNTVKKVEAEIRENCTPRRVIGYGTGLSISVLLDDADVDEMNMKLLMESITVNAGNECESTDIIYAHEEKYDKLLDRLNKEALKYRSGDPFDESKIGLVDSGNIDFIKGELVKRGKSGYLNLSVEGERELLHTSIIPLNKYDTTMEYPGPIVGVRSYSDLDELESLIDRDLKDNQMQKNLVTSVISKSNKKIEEVRPLLKTYIVKSNIPTHDFDLLIPHQGIYIVREFSDPVYNQK